MIVNNLINKIMKVKELIEKLKEYNQEATVYVIKEIDGDNVGVESTIRYYSEDNSKENSTEIYIDILSLGDLD